jgi:tetratricopeptide (TPR) repeat protein
VRASFAVGYAALPQPAARVFRLLGTAPGPTISLPAAVALADGSRRDTEDAVWTLLAAHLLQPVGSDRYRFHDLVRVYAAELAGQRHTEQRDAVGRLLRWCLHTADHASRQLVPGRAPAVADGYWGPGNLPAQASRLSFDGYEPAQAWFDTEKQNLAAAVQLACAAPERALLDLGPRLVWAFWASPYVRGDYDPQWEGLCAAAVRAAQDLADPAAEASARKTQGVLSLYGGRAEEAVEHFEEALAIRTRLGDTSGAAACAVDVACAYSRMGRHDRAINGFRAALDGYRRSDERTKVAILLNNLGIACHRGGDSAEAVLHLEESLQIKNELGDVAGQSKTLTSLVEILYGAGRAEEAAVRSAEALSAVRRNGSRETLALVLEIAVRAHRACGRGGDAERHREELDAVRASLTPEQRASLTAELLRVDTPSPAPAPAPAPAPQERDGRTVTTAGGVSR